jgi:hypothetical protein
MLIHGRVRDHIASAVFRDGSPGVGRKSGRQRQLGAILAPGEMMRRRWQLLGDVAAQRGDLKNSEPSIQMIGWDSETVMRKLVHLTASAAP